MKIICQFAKARAAIETAAHRLLVLLFTSLFAAALARQRFLYALLLARLEVKGVTLDLLDDVLLLDLALETPQGVLKRLALLNANFCQTGNTPKLVPYGL